MPTTPAAPFEDWAEAVYADSEKPLALYLHTPFCRHRCLFCPFYKNKAVPGFSSSYAQALRKEIRQGAAAIGQAARRRPVSAVYFGGGTPSDLDHVDLAAVVRQLANAFRIEGHTEITVEGRIRGFTREKADTLRRAGVNRFSLGLQTADGALRRRLGRLADRQEIRETLQDLSASGAVVIVDLLLGLPGQTRDSILGDVEFLAFETQVHGLDLYALKVFPSSPLETAIAQRKLPELPTAWDRARMFECAANRLADLGFEPFTPKHWRRNASERSVYNRLAKEESDILPLGSGAGGRLGPYSLIQESALQAYYQAVEAGRKPARIQVRPPTTVAASPSRAAVAVALNRCQLPPLGCWGLPEGDASRLAENWIEAGLLSRPACAEGEYPLTMAGVYWHERMQRMLATLQEEEAARPWATVMPA